MASNIPPVKLDTQALFDTAFTTVSKSSPELNKFSLPSVDSVVINVGVGKNDNKQKQEIADYLQKLTAQIPKKVASKVSIASFKVRKGDTVGLVVSLRGQRARDFVLQLIYIALPRTRDFKGVKATAFDKDFSTYSLGIDSSAIFPAIGFDTSINFGMQMNIKFKTKTPLNPSYLTALSFPYKKVA